MSMHNEAAYYYAVAVTKEDLNLRAIANKVLGEKDAKEMSEKGIAEWLTEEMIDIGNGGAIISKQLFSDEIEGNFYDPLVNNYTVLDLWNTDWILLDFPKYPTLFEAPYKDRADLIRQLKELYGPFLKDPEHFQWELHLVKAVIIFYC